MPFHQSLRLRQNLHPRADKLQFPHLSVPIIIHYHLSISLFITNSSTSLLIPSKHQTMLWRSLSPSICLLFSPRPMQITISTQDASVTSPYPENLHEPRLPHCKLQWHPGNGRGGGNASPIKAFARSYSSHAQINPASKPGTYKHLHT